MPLDIAILGANGSPINRVSIDHESHQWMMGRCKSDGLLDRFHDFYGEASVRHVELGELVGELITMQSQATVDTGMYRLLHSLVDIATVAKAQGQALHALPD